MGAWVMEPTGVAYRFHCGDCERSGSFFPSPDEAQADGMEHEHHAHYRKGDALGQGDQWIWWCQSCDRYSDEHRDSYDAACADGFQHELMWHNRVYVIETHGTYDE